jgi:hypothetical protein
VNPMKANADLLWMKRRYGHLLLSTLYYHLNVWLPDRMDFDFARTLSFLHMAPNC